MIKYIPITLWFGLLLTACVSTSRNATDGNPGYMAASVVSENPMPADTAKPQAMTDLRRTQDGGFILAPGFYESEFKTYCLQPGTPDPSSGDAYVPGVVTGYRKEIIESILVNSRTRPEIEQRSIQLLIWCAVSGSDFNNLTFTTQADAAKLLTSKQIFELKGGVAGVIKTVSRSTGIFNANSDLQRLFQMGNASYEAYERIAVLREPAQVRQPGIRYDQWYGHENYYIRYFPLSYKSVRIQVYMPDNILDTAGKLDGEYVVFNPTGQQAIPAFTNAQRLGIGVPVRDIMKVIIQVSKQPGKPRKPDVKKSTPVTNPKQT
jgi:hypothetical protein